MQAVDEAGLNQYYSNNAQTCDTVGVLQEIVGNRHHSPDKSPVTFLFATFDYDGQMYSVIGTTQHRTRESLVAELTPFNTKGRDVVNDAANLAERGYGAKLLVWHIGGMMSMVYQQEDAGDFSCPESNWRSTSTFNVPKIRKELEAGTFSSSDHTPRHYTNDEPEFDAFFAKTSVADSELGKFLRASAMRMFYVFKKAAVTLSKDHIQRLAACYEGNDALKFYWSEGLGCPEIVRVLPSQNLGVTPAHWGAHVAMEFRLGTTPPFADTRLRMNIGEMYHYGKFVTNAKTATSIRLAPDEEWLSSETPDVRVTIAYVNEAYVLGAKKETAATTVAAQVYIRIQGDLISDSPVTDPDLNNSFRAAVGIHPSRMRVVVDILNESAKKNKASGLHLENFKKRTTIRADGSIAACVRKTFSVYKKYMEKKLAKATDSELNALLQECLNDGARHAKRSKIRKQEGLKYESAIAQGLREEFGEDDVIWNTSDVQIMTDHGLSKQGIDVLGIYTAANLMIAIQVKDKGALQFTDIEKFVDSVKELQEKKPKTAILSYFIFKNPKTKIDYKTMRKLNEVRAMFLSEEDNIFTEIETDCNNRLKQIHPVGPNGGR